MTELRVICSIALALVLGLPGATAEARGATPHALEERQLVLESIRVEGNRRISDALIAAHIGIEPGDPVDVEVFGAARLRLLDTDYFTQVDFSTRPGGERATVVLVVEVEERGAASFETGFGYNDIHGWFLTLLGMRSDAPFGTDSRFRLGWRLGFRISGIDAEWKSTLSPQRPFGVGAKVHAYNESHLFFGSGPSSSPAWGDDGWRRFQQDIARVGGEVGLRFRVGSSSRATFGIQGESVDPDSTFTDKGQRDDDVDYAFSELPPSLRRDIEKTAINGFFLRLVRDTRDYENYPRSGSYSRLTFVGNTKFLGSDRDFTKTIVDASKHVAVGERTVLSGRVSGGLISNGAPYYDRFHIGGNYSIRGFEEWSLSPTDGDDGFWLVNTEMRFPLTFSQRTAQPRLTGILFVDAGQGWQNGGSVTVDDIQSAAGYGFRLRLPWLGTLGVDAAIPFSKGNTTDDFRIHVLLGFSF